LAVDASARGALTLPRSAPVNDAGQLIGLLPWCRCGASPKIPLPALVGAEPYGTLCTPLLDRDAAEDAAARMLQQARDAGAHALILRTMSLEGAAMNAIRTVLARDGLRLRVLSAYQRAQLDATRDADELLRDALGPKKLKGAAAAAPAPRRARRAALPTSRAPRTRSHPRSRSFWPSKPAAGRASAARRSASMPATPRSSAARHQRWPRLAVARSSRCMPVTRRCRAASWCVIRTARSSQDRHRRAVRRNILPARS